MNSTSENNPDSPPGPAIDPIGVSAGPEPAEVDEAAELTGIGTFLHKSAAVLMATPGQAALILLALIIDLPPFTHCGAYQFPLSGG